MNKSRIQKKVRKGMDETIFYACNTVFLITVSILFLYPIIYVFSASLSKPVHLMLGDIVLFPKGFTFDSYKEAIRIPNFWLSYWNSIHIVFYRYGSLCFIQTGIKRPYFFNNSSCCRYVV